MNNQYHRSHCASYHTLLHFQRYNYPSARPRSPSSGRGSLSVQQTPAEAEVGSHISLDVRGDAVRGTLLVKIPPTARTSSVSTAADHQVRVGSQRQYEAMESDSKLGQPYAGVSPGAGTAPATLPRHANQRMNFTAVLHCRKPL